MKFGFFAALAVLALGTAAQSATIAVSETAAPGGDYADFLGATGTGGRLLNNIGAAPAGTTTVTVDGSLRCDSFPCIGSGADQFDALYFEIGPDQELTKLAFESSGGAGILQANLFDTSDSSLVFGRSIAIGSSVTFLDVGGGDAPLTTGTYNFSVSILQPTAPGTVSWTASSSLRDTLAVAPIPLPAGGLLLLAGLGGLALTRRRR